MATRRLTGRPAKRLEETISTSKTLGLFQKRGVPRLVAAAFVARLPLSMMGLATVFFVENKTASPAAAGLAVAAFSVAAAALAPVRGRLVDRRGIRAGLVPLTMIHACATAGLLLRPPFLDPVIFFAIAAGLGGATAPPVNAAMRALWPSLVSQDSIDAAYATEAVLQETSYLLGPLLVGLIIAAASPAAAIVVAAVLTVLGGVAFAHHEAAQKLGRSERVRGGPLGCAGVRVILAALFFGSLAAGVLEVAIPTFAREHSSGAGAGLLLAAMAAVSLSAGVWYGAKCWRISPSRRFIGASAVAAFGYLVMIPADSLAVLSVGALLVGLTSAPSMAAVYSILDEVAPGGARVETVTWITTSTAGGAAFGAVLGGLLIDDFGMHASLASGAIALTLGVTVTVVWRSRLGEPPPQWKRPLFETSESTRGNLVGSAARQIGSEPHR